MKKLILIFSICTFAWLGLSGCGDDDCTVCPDDPPPAQPDYHLLYSYVGQWPDNYVLTYSTKSGKEIDSAYYHGSMFKSMDFSHDGRYACYTDDYHGTEGYSETWVADTQTGDTVSYVRGVGAMAVVISPNDQFALLSGSHFMAVVRLPSLAVVFQDSVDSWVGKFGGSRGVLYISLEAALDSMYVIDFESVPPVWKSFPIAFYDGTPAQSLGPIA
ncbi:MAG: hypothetical protein WBP29_00960 [Candidatus Zixiibacteriota bacterium]